MKAANKAATRNLLGIFFYAVKSDIYKLVESDIIILVLHSLIT
ncbi:Hypothetical protein PAU_03512 [Photorhabdus asymbiotica]|uniref:Uncharacterized protein n=1 Tax=Photorhabdus asymbiotica subsp. asymbiotica (strain ATCC 43949 / 3105-77) TaxID=553480 RepID=C7BKA3_PHOAA|nr:Hypothetical protein PAU_03512 [Photorhabdus asymbiotica]